MSGEGFDDLGNGRYRVHGDLGFRTVPVIWEQSRAALLRGPSELEIDLGAVRRVDSAGLALTIEWLREASEAGKQLSLVNVPDKLLALARLSEVDHLLTAGTLPG